MEKMKASCSSFTCTTQDNKHFLGRTYDEYGNIDYNKIVVIPRKYPISLMLNSQKDNPQVTDYATVGMNVSYFDTPFLTEGMNEYGVIGALLFFPHYSAFDTVERAYNVNPGLLLPFILGKCKSLEEVVHAINKVNLVNEVDLGIDLPCHYMFTDKTGEAIVVEPIESGIKIYRNEIGVLTNSPTYDWHKINLSNYLGTTNLARKPQTIGNYTIDELGEGTGYLGIPGDYTPVSRFIRLAFSKEYMTTPINELDAITKMFNTFETVDVPDGVIYTPPEQKSDTYYEKTLCTSIMCAESLKYYFATASNRRVCCVDLTKEKDKGSTTLLEFVIPFTQDILNLN